MKKTHHRLRWRMALVAAMIIATVSSALALPTYTPPGRTINGNTFNGVTASGVQPTPTFADGFMKPLLFSNTPNWNISPQLQKFVNTLAPLGCSSMNDLNQCIPVAVPDIVTYPGTDYYVIEVVQYTEKMHTDLGATTLRGYRQTNSGTNTASCSDPSLSGQSNPACTSGANTVIPPATAHYLGPMIIAQKDRPVRIKLVNNLPTGTAGKLFLPVDTTLMGAGKGPLKADGTACTYHNVAGAPINYIEYDAECASYPENRTELHLHGGLSPWISDGTPHQWIAPAGEVTPYKRGASAKNVPDMEDPGDGAVTYYYTNQQSARLMFYHDHSVGLTRLNVYAGEAAGYMIQDDVEKALVDNRVIPGKNADEQIALIIQDKNFVDPATIAQTDPTWAWGTKANPLSAANASGDLWWPHVYMVAENPYVVDGVNPMGRWVYGLFFWPPTTGIPYQLTDNPYYDPACDAGPTAPGCVTDLAFEPPQIPKIPNPSWVAEAFMDTMLVNGTVYPTLAVEPKPYRLRILNAAHDRFLNLQLYKSTTTLKTCTVDGGSGYAVGDLITFTGGLDPSQKYARAAEASVTSVNGSGAITGIRIDNYGSHYLSTPTGISIDSTGTGAAINTTPPASCSLQADTEVAMVPAVGYREYNKLNKAYVPNDNRDGGVPDPTTAGPDWIQIGTEGGFLAKPAVIPPYPVTFLTDPTQFNVGNVIEGSLRMGPAERADVVVDFSQYAGKTLILYNDAPAAYPAAVANNDYYTGAPDLSDAGGAAEVIPGYGPNTRTIMQIVVGSTATDPISSGTLLTNIQKEFTKSTATGGLSVFEKGQEPVIVGQEAYNDTYGKTFPWRAPNWGYSEIGDNYLKYFDTTTIGTAAPATSTLMQPKAIHDEMGAVYDEYGRMSARLGVEVPLSNNLNQTFVMQSYIDPPTEILTDGQIQIWKITHNGVDTHPMHFHLFDVQVINRVGWDGFKRLPDANELGWKETVRVSPLEDTIVAMRPRAPKLPFGLPDSIRRLAPGLPDDVTQGFTNLETTGANTGQVKIPADTNAVYNFGDEYVWHCHILSHEEQDMMRPVQFNTSKTTPDAPSGLVAPATFSGSVALTWSDPTPFTSYTQANNPKNEIGFIVQRSSCGNSTTCGSYSEISRTLANSPSYSDSSTASSPIYKYRVLAFNAKGVSTASDVVTTTTTAAFNGSCGASNGQSFDLKPATGLCLVGDPSAVTGTGPWSWTCSAFNSGTAATCGASIKTYAVTYTAGGIGTLTGTTTQTINYGANATTVTAAPSPGYQFVKWTNTAGTTVSLLPALTVTNVTAAETYTARFYVPKDFNTDGNVDILWTDTTTNNSIIWYMNNTTKLSEASLPASPGAGYSIVATGDFNNDGQTDILYRNQTTGANVLYYMNGVTKVSEVTLTALTNNATNNWVVGGIGDFNGDGNDDIIWRNTISGQNVVWYMNNATRTSLASLPTLANNATNNWVIGGIGDFDGNGTPDIVWRNTISGQNVVWYMNNATRTGIGSFTTLANNATNNWVIGGVHDANKDGKPDILWRNTISGQNVIWYMNNTIRNSIGSLPTLSGSNLEIVGK